MRNKLVFMGVVALILASFIYIHIVPGYFLIKNIFIFLMSLSFMHAFYYIKEEIETEKDVGSRSFINSYGFKIAFIAVCLIIAMIPIMSKSFLFGDDIMELYKNRNIKNAIGQLRPLGGILCERYCFYNYSFYIIPKIINCAVLYIFALIFHNWLIEKTKKKLFSLALTVMLVCSTIFVELVGYILICPSIYAMLLSAISIICYDNFVNSKTNKKSEKVFYLISSILTLLGGFCFNQLATSIVFAFIAIALFEQPQKLKYTFTYMMEYAITILLYIGFTKWLVSFYGLPRYQENRGEIITTLDGVGEKISMLISQAINRIISIFTGNSVFYQKVLLYHTGLTRELRWIEALSYFLVILFCICMLYSFLVTNKKSRVDVLQIIFLVPLTIWPRIVLKDPNSFASYNIVALIFILMFYIMTGIDFLFKKVNEKLKIGVLLAIIMLVIYQSYSYGLNEWVIPNRAGYFYMKNTLVQNISNNEKIHILGMVGYGMNEIHSVDMIERILHEEKLNPENYIITASTQDDIVGHMYIAKYNEIKNLFTEEEQRLVEKYYKKIEEFDGYYYNYNKITQEDRKKLTNMFKRAKLLKQDDTFIIDLRKCEEIKRFQEIY